MATLDSSNIVNGNTIESNDILQLYSALGSTNPGSITGLVMTGSLDGSATSIIIPTPPTPTGSYYPTLVPGVGTQNLEIGTMEYNAATDTLITTSSYANQSISSSYSLSTNQLINQEVSGQGNPITMASLKVIAGEVTMLNGIGISQPFPSLIGKTLGLDVFLTATLTGFLAQIGDTVVIKTINGVGEIEFSSNGNPTALNGTVNFTGFVKS